MSFVRISFPQKSELPLIKAEYCNSFILKFKGLMFHPGISNQEGVLFTEKTESILNTSIHMFFMKFDIAVIWVDQNFDIVDVQLAKKWHPYYASRKPAKYVVETHPIWTNLVHIGDKIQIEYD